MVHGKPASSLSHRGRATHRPRFRWAIILVICVVLVFGVFLWAPVEHSSDVPPAAVVRVATPPPTLTTGLSPRLTSREQMAPYKFFVLRDRVTKRYLADTDGANRDSPKESEKIFHITPDNRYKAGAFVFKGTSGRYADCRAMLVIDFTSPKAGPNEQLTLEFTPVQNAGANTSSSSSLSSNNVIGGYMTIQRFGSYFALSSDKKMLTVWPGATPVQWELYGVTSCNDENSCWGPESQRPRRVLPENYLTDMTHLAASPTKIKPKKTPQARKDASKKNHPQQHYSAHDPEIADLSFPLFGTPKPFSIMPPKNTSDKYDPTIIQTRAMRNWASLPGMRPLFFTDDKETTTVVEKLNEEQEENVKKYLSPPSSFKSLPSFVVPRNKFMIDNGHEIHAKIKQPTARGLFKRALELFPDSPAVAFSNCDILLSPSVSDTIRAAMAEVRNELRQKKLKAGLTGADAEVSIDEVGQARWLITGMRVNLDLSPKWEIKTDEDAEELMRLAASNTVVPDWAMDMDKLGRSGSFYSPFSYDKFVVSRAMYDWKKFLDLIVGASYWDTYTMREANVLARKGDAMAVDASRVILAIHQNHASDPLASANTKKSKYNEGLMAKNDGIWQNPCNDNLDEAKLDENGEIQVYRRYATMFE